MVEEELELSPDEVEETVTNILDLAPRADTATLLRATDTVGAANGARSGARADSSASADKKVQASPVVEERHAVVDSPTMESALVANLASATAVASAPSADVVVPVVAGATGSQPESLESIKSSEARPKPVETTEQLPVADLMPERGRDELPSFPLVDDETTKKPDPAVSPAPGAALEPAGAAGAAPSLAESAPFDPRAAVRFEKAPESAPIPLVPEPHNHAPLPIPSRPPPAPNSTPPPSAVATNGLTAPSPSRLSPPTRPEPRGIPSLPLLPLLPEHLADLEYGGTRRVLSEQIAIPLSSLVGAGGLLIAMVVGSFFVGRASFLSPTAATAHPSLQTLPALTKAAIPPPPRPCWMVKQPAMWAPAASRTIPFEAVATTSGATKSASLAFGYARDAHRAMGVEIDLASGEIKPKLDDKGDDEIERVVPSAAAEFTVTRAGKGSLKAAVEVPATPPFVLGQASSGVAIAASTGADPVLLWPLEGDDPITASNVRAAGDKGFALVFRRSGAVWGGFLTADRRASGALTKVVGSGGAVGKPSVAWNGRELAVIFADKPAGADHYEIRLAHGPVGSVPAATAVFPLPKGGPGGDAFSPDIAGLPDGRWLLMWTEGASGSRAMRAQTLAPDFTPLGDPIALSPPAGSFGQGVIGVAGSYAATIFLSQGASQYELWGSVLQCGD